MIEDDEDFLFGEDVRGVEGLSSSSDSDSSEAGGRTSGDVGECTSKKEAALLEHLEDLATRQEAPLRRPGKEAIPLTPTARATTTPTMATTSSTEPRKILHHKFLFSLSLSLSLSLAGA